MIRLSQLPGDQVKNAVAEFFLMALYSFLIRREHPHRLERLLVLDEAWRLVNSPFLEPLMREGRAFGLGVIIATQFPKDLPEQIAGSTATRLFFNQTKAEQVREIQRTLVGKTSGQEADHLGNLIRGLAPLECVLQNLQYRPWIRLRAVPYCESPRRTRPKSDHRGRQGGTDGAGPHCLRAQERAIAAAEADPCAPTAPTVVVPRIAGLATPTFGCASASPAAACDPGTRKCCHLLRGHVPRPQAAAGLNPSPDRLAGNRVVPARST